MDASNHFCGVPPKFPRFEHLFVAESVVFLADESGDGGAAATGAERYDQLQHVKLPPGRRSPTEQLHVSVANALNATVPNFWREAKHLFDLCAGGGRRAEPTVDQDCSLVGCYRPHTLLVLRDERLCDQELVGVHGLALACDWQ